MLNVSSCPPGHNTPIPLERSPPGSFKRLLGGAASESVTRAIEGPLLVHGRNSYDFRPDDTPGGCEDSDDAQALAEDIAIFDYGHGSVAALP